MARLPDQIGKYKVTDRIGKGGMGVVYKARHPTLDRFVILKKLTVSGDAVMRERFRREAEIMIDFRTDYVVDVYDHFRDGKSDYIALEYVDGGSLDEILSRERYLPDSVALLIIRDCCLGLDYVHGKGVVHRDVKPGNVLVGRDGSVKLLDFGIASREDSFADDLTREGMTLGTVAYIAPEQIEQSRSADLRADIYSTGAMLYEMATGRKAFAGGFTPENVNRIQRGRYRAPRRVNPQISRFTARLIRRCMRRNPKRRYGSAGDIVAAVDGYLRRRKISEIRETVATVAGSQSASSQRSLASRRRWPRIVVAVVAVMLLAVGAAYGTGYFQRYLMSRSHSLVQYQIRIRKSDFAGDHGAIQLRLQRAVEDGMVRVTPFLPLLHPVSALETPDYIILRSRLLTLPAGRYDSTVRLGDAHIHDAVQLLPLSATPDVQTIRAIYEPGPVTRLSLIVEPYDAMTGEAIVGAVTEVESDSEWRLLSGDLAEGTSGPGSTRDGQGDPEQDTTPLFVSVDDLAVALSGGLATIPVEAPLPEPALVPGETIRLRVTHDDYATAITSFLPDTFARSAIARIAMTRADATTEEKQ